MTDADSSGQTSGLYKSLSNDVHRVNGIFYGHPGRITYIPSEDVENGLGKLSVTRVTGQTPLFRQLSPFEQWLPSTRAEAPVPTLEKTSQSTVKSGDQGFWCSDGAPILQIKFASRHRKYNQIRWLIVQKATSTTVFEPELRGEPVNDVESRCYLDLGRPNHIAANPIVTITQGATGGDPHCDFSFSPGFDADPPQLAIIDRSGRWTVLHVMRDRFGGSKSARPTIKYTGSLVPAPMKGIGASPPTHRGWYTIHWISQADTGDWEDPGSPSTDFVRLRVNNLPSGLRISPKSSGTLMFQQVVLFWFSLEATVRQPHIHQQTVQVTQVDDTTLPGTLRLECLLPLPAKVTRRRNNSDGLGDELQHAVRFYQFLGLGSDLSLHSSLNAVSADQGHVSGAPDVRFDRLWRQGKRKAYLHRVEDSFVLPDELRREVVPEAEQRPGPGLTQLARIAERSSRSRNLRSFFSRVIRGINDTLNDDESAVGTDKDGHDIIPFQSIREIVERGVEEGQATFVSLLDFIDHIQRPPDFDVAGFDWNSQIDELQGIDSDRVRIVQQSAHSMRLSPADLFEKFSILWSARLPPNALREATERRMQAILQRLAIEISLSGLGLMVNDPAASLYHDELPSPDSLIKREGTPSAQTQNMHKAGLPTPSASPAPAPAPIHPEADNVDYNAQDVDPVIKRLQMYMTIRTLPPPNKPGSRLLSHWPEQRGSDPAEDSFIPGNLKRDRGRDSRRKQRNASKRRQSSERSIRGSSPASGPSTQPLPRIIHSSQIPDNTSQSQPSSLPVQPMSQPVSGLHGVRVTPSRKKSKGKGRKSIGGFR
ncbi:hypothetical protein NKR23_g11134 [Pleurostoma richardsiae]|uniref:RNA polymerase I-specific transcription initiation factor RRN6-like protein n=1 Tax=Pleurostoma richardsiae TaxID=41990 RepID=A0AA38VHA3_9PEZI|nr:hypothetical protein NKR23_g11134 [Pleurostoma richardsiae]